MLNATVAVKNDMMILQKKIKSKITIESSNSTPRYTHKRSKNKALNRYLYARVHSRITYNNQKVKSKPNVLQQVNG